MFKNNKFMENLLKKGIVIFPIDIKKIPYELNTVFTKYDDYLNDTIKHFYVPTRSGTEQ